MQYDWLVDIEFGPWYFNNLTIYKQSKRDRGIDRKRFVFRSNTKYVQKHDANIAGLIKVGNHVYLDLEDLQRKGNIKVKDGKCSPT